MMLKRSMLITVCLLTVTACAKPLIKEDQQSEKSDGMHEMEGHEMDEMEGHMDHDDLPQLVDSTGENELLIPPIAEKVADGEVDYEIIAQEGKTEFYPDIETDTYGYNGALLGPTLRLEEGETIKVRVGNELAEPTTFHWHGLEIPGEEDGGPQQEVLPGEEKIVTLKANQEAASLWYHPHPHELTAKQVFKGLSGMLYVDEKGDSSLPNTYGVNDIPLILQDRLFDGDKQLDYDTLMNSDGTIGDISIVNGTVNPKLTVKESVMRFRLLNGANARNYTVHLSNGATFMQIAGDGGRLAEPVEVEKLTLSASERAEILIDFSAFDEEDVALVDEEGAVLLPFEFDNEAMDNSRAVSWEKGQPFITEEEQALPVSKEIELYGMMDQVTINGKKFDPNRIDFTQKQGVTEVWEVYNKPDQMGGMIHPFHIHGTQFKILSRDGKPVTPQEEGLKDSVLIEPDETVQLLVTFPEKGVFMFHCHILEHEDNGMMGQVEVY